MVAITESVIVPLLTTVKLPSVAIDVRTVSASSNKVMFKPLAEILPSVTVPGLPMVTVPVIETSETAPLTFKTSVVLSDNRIKPAAFKFIEAAWMLAPTESVIVPLLTTVKLPGVPIDVKTASASSNKVMFKPLAETLPSVTVPGLPMVTELVVEMSETALLTFKTSVVLSDNRIKPAAFKFIEAAWILAPAESVIVPLLTTVKLPGVAIDVRTVSVSSNKVMFEPLAEMLPSVTVPGLPMVTESVVEMSEIAPLTLKTSIALSDNRIKPAAFRFIEAAWMLAPTESVIVPLLTTVKLPGVAIDVRTVSASSNKVMFKPLAEMLPSVTVPGLPMVTELVVEMSETAPLTFKTSLVLPDNRIKPAAFRFMDAAWILALTEPVIAPLLKTVKLPGVAIDVRVEFASSCSVTFVPLAEKSPIATEPGLAMDT